MPPYQQMYTEQRCIQGQEMAQWVKRKHKDRSLDPERPVSLCLRVGMGVETDPGSSLASHSS